MKYLISVLIAFFMGSIPFAYIVGRVTKHIDIREYGSHNPGAGNVFHLISWRAGLVALLGDMGKGFFAMWIIHTLYEFPPAILSYCAIFAVLGHVFSPFLKFRGGKGAATTLGSFLYILFIALSWEMFLLLFFLAIPWGITLIITHSQVVSLAVTFPFFPPLVYFMTHDKNFVLATVIFVIMLETLGIPSLRREWPKAYEKYVSRLFKKH